MNFPERFKEMAQEAMGSAIYEKFIAGLAEPAACSIRLNPFKTDHLAISPTWNDGMVPWCDKGYYLNSRPSFTFDPLMHAGAYYVQEASSMFLYHVLKHLIHRPISMLDLCAAPGGKTTCALSALPKGSRILSNEVVRQRAEVLAENVLKFGAEDIIVTNNTSEDYAHSSMLFDAILVDAPCSGEGMFRKDEDAIREWSVEKVDHCQHLQRSILNNIWHSLRPGGYLIYSTCTYNTQENEENLAWMVQHLGAAPVNIPVDPAWHVLPALKYDYPAYRFIPGITRGEGIFMCVVQKHGESVEHSPTPTCDLRGFKVLFHGIAQDIVKGKQRIPHISKALLGDASLPGIDVDRESALTYLKRQPIFLPADAPKGYCTVRYMDLPIGLVKNIGMRANNLHPHSWAIKSGYAVAPFHILERV